MCKTIHKNPVAYTGEQEKRNAKKAEKAFREARKNKHNRFSEE